MKLIKSKRRSVRVLKTVISLLLIIVMGVAGIYGVGLISPLTKSLFFGIVFGAPDIIDIIVSGVITLLPFSIIILFLKGLYKLGRALYKGPFNP